MTLIIEKPTGAALRMRQTWQPMDPDAAAYLAAVEAADGQSLEEKTKIAIDNFVLGCKNDGIWPAIKASCILAGARTLAGALVPLVGTAPTNNNFVSGDYNRKTGLVGDGSTKYLDSNRNNNADPKDSKHISCFCTTSQASGAGAYFGAGVSTSPNGGESAHFIDANGLHYFTINSFSYSSGIAGSTRATGLLGANRSASVTTLKKAGSFTRTDNISSQTSFNGDVLIFARGSVGSIDSPTTARLAFYSIGESLNLTQLDTRVSALYTAIGAAF